MKKKLFPLALFVLITGFTFSWQACHKPGGRIHVGCGGPMVGSEPTSVMLVFTNTNNATDVDTAMWTNWYPNTPNSAIIDNSKAHLTLSANASYHVQVFILDLHAAPGTSAYNVTTSVVTESSSYLMCFSDSANYFGNLGANLNWNREDVDNSTQHLPLGLADSFWTGPDSTVGLLTATLHHQYKVKTGDCSPGYIDIQALDTVYISPNKLK